MADADAAWPDEDADHELPDEVVVVPNDDVVPKVLLKVHPASATAITTKKTAIMPYDEIFTVFHPKS